MNLRQICEHVNDLIEDKSYVSDVPVFVNEVYLRAVNEDGIRIPTLKGLSVVSTVVGQNYTSLLTDTPDFSGKLVRVGDGNKITIYATLEDLFDEYQKDGVFPNEEGDVTGVALEGNTLWYQKIPAAATSLGIIYYKDPTLLEKDSDIPSALPSAVHLELLVYGAAMLISDRIEDGVEGPKINTMAFERRYLDGLWRLRGWLAARRNSNRTSVWDY